MNRVILSGNLTRDPELRYIPAGNACCEASVAVTERWKSKSGEQKEKTSFIGLVLWDATAESFAKYHRKGSKVLIEGKLTQERWEKDGQKKEKTKVQVERWEFAGDRRADSPASESSSAAPAATTAATDDSDDVPF